MADDPAEVTAAQAYRRLLRSAQAALAEPGGTGPAAVLLAGPLAEADRALAAAGLAGNERRFFAVVRSATTVPTARRGPAPT
ncbi:hypothetical protein O7599_00405 [Streptomyces sp. WMMC500]|uniref:hypothetical protein n=1 Tax=Streptomyces sp. WMMC500 TaxID=3015154 RepID=UPI00248AF315|nr:hypothetical protein [Streptomyces sp. WMMC500]WBB61057.1 hypothetical protein O7599_00405 [Streptomyces sp. WMMC500]